MTTDLDLASVVACDSHKARRRLYIALGHKPIALYSLRRDAPGGFFAVAGFMMDTALRVKGCHRAKDGDDLMVCWS